MIKLKNYFIIFSIILFILCLFFSKNLEFDASSDTLILQNDKTYKYFEYYNNIFPTQNFLVLAVKSETIIDRDYIDNINKIKDMIEDIDGIESTFSIVDAPILLLNNVKISDLANQKIMNINNSDLNLDLILEEFTNSPIFKNQIINTNKNVSSIILYLKKNKEFINLKKKRKILLEDNNNSKEKLNFINKKYRLKKIEYNKKRQILISKIRQNLAKQNNSYQYYLGGIDMIANDTINFVKKDIAIFSFVILFFIILVLFIIYRDIKWVIIPLITTSYSVITMTGFIGIMNWEITAISSNFISLMLILSISMNIHIINNYKNNDANEPNLQKLKLTFKSMFWPCFYTALTTMVAFGSLLFSNIRPLIDFGYIMVLGLFLIFITSFTILPLLIYLFPKINKVKSLKLNILKSFVNVSINKSNRIIVFNLIILIISIVGIFKLNVENSFINYFKSNTEIYKGMKLIDDELGGTTPLDILIKFENSDENKNINENNEKLEEDLDLDLDLDENLFNLESKNNNIWFTKEKLNVIEKIHIFLESRVEIGKVQSLHSLIDVGNKINNKKLNIFELSILYKEIPENYKERLIDPYLSIENNMIKISARIKDSNKIERKKLINEINYFIKSEFNNLKEYKINGLLVLYNNMLQSLFKSQIKSFGLILLSIFIMFLILFKSVKLSIIGIIPNIIASIFILGLIGLLGIPLDIMTITIAAVTIGIAVDNTIHYIYRIKLNKIKYKDKKIIIEKTHNNVGYAILTTSLTIAFGFSALSLSNFIPTILFGLFTGLAMIVAMLGVLLTLPSILIKFRYD